MYVCLCVQLLPKNCASLIAVNVNRKKAKNRIPAEAEKPGEESYRKHREEFTRLCFCLRSSSAIYVYWLINICCGCGCGCGN